MKKTIIILLALVMVLSLAACGGGSAATNTQAATQAADNTPAPAETETPATPKEEFYGEWENFETGETLTIDSRDIIFEYPDGGSYQSSWIFAEIVGDTLKDNEPIGELKLTVVDGSKQLVGTAGTFITAEDAAAKRISESVSVGEKYAGNNFEITVKSTEYAEYLNKDNATRVFERDVSWDKAGDGKVFMIIKFDYTNLAKQNVDMVRDVKFSVIYKDGYEFISFDEEKAYIFEDDVNGVFRQCKLDSGGYLMELSPLTSGAFFIAIPVAEIVSTDTDSPIRIQVDYGENIKGGALISETALITVQ